MKPSLEILEEIAEEIVADKNWRWMAGMLTLPYFDEYGEESHPPWRLGDDLRWPGAGWENDSLPDLDDPATLGCFLALVREAWNDPYASVTWEGSMWVCSVCYNGQKTYFKATSCEQKALFYALRNAPKNE